MSFAGCRLAGAAWLFELSPQSCVRENCPACMSGEQHRSYVLYGRQKGRRVAVYVPEELVPEVQRGLDMARLRLGMVRAATLRRNVLNLL